MKKVLALMLSAVLMLGVLAGCGTYEAVEMYFVPQSGEILCGNCKGRAVTPVFPLSRSVLQAMRHIIYSDFSKLFAFTLAPESLEQLSLASERFVKAQVDTPLPTLDFYQSLQS